MKFITANHLRELHGIDLSKPGDEDSLIQRMEQRQYRRTMFKGALILLAAICLVAKIFG